MPEAKVAFSRALEEQREHGAEISDVMCTVEWLCDVYFNMNDLALAEQMYKSVLDWKVTKWGARHWTIMVTAYRLACTYTALGQYGEAETLFSRAKNGFTELLGPSDGRTLGAAR